MHDDTRQNPGDRPGLVDQIDDLEYDSNTIQDTVLEVKELMGIRTALEHYRDQIKASGKDGLDPVAKAVMQVNLEHLGLANKTLGLESFGTQIPSSEDFAEKLANIGEHILALINKLIEAAKQFASKIMAGLETVKTEAEKLMDRLKKRYSDSKSSNEFHEGDREVTLNNPTLLFADGEFCLDDCRGEQEVIKFFINVWPKYATEQINRAKKMISEYDVESGNSENFESNAGFIGNHESISKSVSEVVLPGNKAIAFKYVALGPELVDAEGAKPAPATHTFKVRTNAEMNGTLRKNVATMNALGNLFKAEGDVLQHMVTLSQALGELENRRGESVWKSARDALDDISNMMMELITRLKPNYDPIARHLAKVGAARNAAVAKEMEVAA